MSSHRIRPQTDPSAVNSSIAQTRSDNLSNYSTAIKHIKKHLGKQSSSSRRLIIASQIIATLISRPLFPSAVFGFYGTGSAWAQHVPVTRSHACLLRQQWTRAGHRLSVRRRGSFPLKSQLNVALAVPDNLCRMGESQRNRLW